MKTLLLLPGANIVVGGDIMIEKKPVRFRNVAAWYHGNYCCMKCLREDEDFERLECYKKILEFMEDKGDRMIAHRDFICLVREELCICDTKNFKKEELSECPVCRKMGIPQRKWW